MQKEKNRKTGIFLFHELYVNYENVLIKHIFQSKLSKHPPLLPAYLGCVGEKKMSQRDLY